MNTDIDCTFATQFLTESGINLSDTENIQYQPLSDAPLDNIDIENENESYPALSDAQESDLRDGLVDNWTAAETILNYIKIWKEHPPSSSSAMQTHEQIIKTAFDVTTDVIRGGSNAENVTDEYIEVMKCIYCIGQQFLEEHSSGSINCYRGLRYNLPHIAKEILETMDTEYVFKSTVLTNFTGSEYRALEYSRVQVQIEVDRAGIVLPTDQLFKHRENGVTDERDGELQVCGDTIPDLPHPNVYVLLQNGKKSLRNLLGSITDLSGREHLVVRSIIIEMAYRELQLNDERGRSNGLTPKDDLKSWFSRYTSEFHTDALLLTDLFQYVIGEESSRPDTHELFQKR